jgi:hypothetical protein
MEHNTAVANSTGRILALALVFLTGILSNIATGGGGSSHQINTVTASPEYFQTTTGDLDNDGLPDLIALSRFENATRLERLSRDFAADTFAQTVETNVTGVNGSLVVADVDIDGTVDIMASQPDTNNILILRQFDPANSVFGARIEYVAGNRPGALAAADVDLDGLADIVIADETGIVVRIQDTSNVGSFPSIRTVDDSQDPGNAFSEAIQTLGTGDANDDGLIDIAAARADGVRLYLNDLANIGTFPSAAKLLFETTPETLVLEDINGDGLVDIIGAGPGFVSILQHSDGLPDDFLAEIQISIQNGVAAPFLKIGDMNDDGLQDIVVGNLTDLNVANTVQVLLQSTQDFDFPRADTYDIPDSGELLRGMALDDIDNDGLQDVIISQTEIYSLINSNQQPGTLTAPAQLTGN